MEKFKRIMLWLWQLPQNLLGLLMMLILQGETRHRLGSIRFYYLKTFPGGITLGEYIFVGTKQDLTVRHEFGHVVQSRYLGPLYLLVIGLPSLLHAWLNGATGCCDRHPEGYYHFYTEKWADRDKALLEVENLQAQSEQAWSKRDTYKEIADKCAQIRAEFSPAFKEKKETEERFTKLEGSVDELKDMIKGLVKELKG